MGRLWFGLGALAGLGAVGMTAYAAHGLEASVQRLVASASQMQGWHALALLATGLWAPRGGRWADAAGFAFIAGLLLFCGSVYALALQLGTFNGLAPIGGTLLMTGWALLAVSAWRAR